jgi:hypothetical protein
MAGAGLGVTETERGPGALTLLALMERLLNKPIFLTFGVYLLALTACSNAYPVVAICRQNRREILRRSTLCHGRRKPFKMTSADGVVCNGKYIAEVIWHAKDPASTVGNFKCSDGWTGIYSTAGTIYGGQGVGKFSSGNKFETYYGQVADPK